jgi:hypothetical protein
MAARVFGTEGAIMLGDNTIGVIAVAPGNVWWIDGELVSGEVIRTTHGGSGLATSARATALPAARRPVLQGVFVQLPR